MLKAPQKQVGAAAGFYRGRLYKYKWFWTCIVQLAGIVKYT